MEKTTFQDQPTPDTAPTIAQLTPTQRLQEQTGKLAQLLLRQAQMRGGAIDVLSLELNVQIMAAQIQVLSQLLLQVTGGTLTDDMMTTILADRVSQHIMQTESALNAPQIARGNVPKNLNGNRH